jgi:hypothetical protein
MSFSDYFDKAYCINLDRRKDRWTTAQSEFKRIGITAKRVSAIDGNDFPPYAGLKPGANGCRLSHLKILTMANQAGYEKIFIAEDDIIFHEDFNNKFNEASKNIPDDWDMIYLCANPHTGERKPVAEGVQRMTGGYSSHAILMKNTFFNVAIDKIYQIPYQIDVAYGILQSSFNCYITIPHLAFQSNGFSDIENQDVNYDFFKV